MNHRATVETPPRTWRRLGDCENSQVRVGNTSTDVEKTLQMVWCAAGAEKHLHGRGEDHLIDGGCDRVLGNTSTDVEKTFHRYV